MKYSKTCEHCGHSETAYTYNLNVGKVRALQKLVEKYESTKKPVQLGDLIISNSQYTNFCHLAYFGLVQHVTEGWLPTALGIEFTYNQVGVYVPVAVMNGIVLAPDHEAWSTHGKSQSLVFAQDIDSVGYKRKSEYVEEIATVGKLF